MPSQKEQNNKESIQFRNEQLLPIQMQWGKYYNGKHAKKNEAIVQILLA